MCARVDPSLRLAGLTRCSRMSLSLLNHRRPLSFTTIPLRYSRTLFHPFMSRRCPARMPRHCSSDCYRACRQAHRARKTARRAHQPCEIRSSMSSGRWTHYLTINSSNLLPKSRRASRPSRKTRARLAKCKVSRINVRLSNASGRTLHSCLTSFWCFCMFPFVGRELIRWQCWQSRGVLQLAQCRSRLDFGLLAAAGLITNKVLLEKKEIQTRTRLL